MSDGRCRYCGAPAVSGVCRAHSDLPAREREPWTATERLAAELADTREAVTLKRKGRPPK